LKVLDAVGYFQVLTFCYYHKVLALRQKQEILGTKLIITYVTWL